MTKFFVSSQNVLISSSFLKDIFAGNRIGDFELFLHLKNVRAMTPWFLIRNLSQIVFPIGMVSFLSLFSRFFLKVGNSVNFK